MAASKAKATHLNVVPLCYQAGKDRFNQPPRVSPWRNNLTALSQYHNLYFVALETHIHIFQPTFPEQRIPSKPVFKLRYASTGHHARGFLEPSNPHAANHIVVGDLGTEEILLISCDDGDVIGYYIRSLLSAIEEASPEIVPPRPFFGANVGLSAWGLAVHKQARLIAVSSNTHKILVFAFALTKETSPGSRGSHGPFSFYPFDDSFLCFEPASCLRDPNTLIPDEPELKSRRSNVVFPLEGHGTNIPDVAFWNGGLHNDKVYLASIDISGAVIVWDVWGKQQVFKTEVFLGENCCRGWSVQCLDPFNAQIADTSRDAFGCDELETTDAGMPGRALDNSDSVKDVPDNALVRPPAQVEPLPPGTGPDPAVQALIFDELEDQEDDYEEDEDFDDYDPEFDDDMVAEETTTITETEASSPQSLENFSVDAGGISTTWSNIINGPHLRLDSFNPSSISTSVGINPKFSRPIYRTTLPINLLCTSEMDISLFTDLKNNPTTCNSLICKRPTLQRNGSGIMAVRSIERLNMSHQIPELGVVVTANQAGRVVIMTMTIWPSSLKSRINPSSPQYPRRSSTSTKVSIGEGPTKRDSGLSESTEGFDKKSQSKNPKFNPNESLSKSPGDTSAFKIQAIVPFESQERKGHRSFKPLLGIAVSPIQGHNGMPNTTIDTGNSISRKWRLILMYYDHTTVTYEIYRPRTDAEVLII